MILSNIEKQPQSGKYFICVLLSLIFFTLYLEPIAIFGIKFSHIYKFVIIYFLLISIFTHRSHGVIDHYEKSYAVLLYTAYCWAMLPILFSFTRNYMFDSIFIGGQRLFSILLFHWVLHKKYTLDRLFMFYELFLLFAILATLPFLAGLLQPLGQSYDLSKITDDKPFAFIGVFQNSHAASTILSMCGVGAFSISCTTVNRGKKSYYLILTSIFLVLTVLTYSRSGWISFIFGVLSIFWLIKNTSQKYSIIKVFISLIGIILVAIPQVINNTEALTMRALGQTKYNLNTEYNLNNVSSGRLSIWKASGRIFLESTTLEKLAGIGEEELRKRMYREIGAPIFSHNGFINQLLVDGLIGLIILLYLLVYIYLLFSSLAIYKYRVLCISTLFCWLTHFFFQGGDFPIATAFLFLLVAISLLAHNRSDAINLNKPLSGNSAIDKAQ